MYVSMTIQQKYSSQNTGLVNWAQEPTKCKQIWLLRELDMHVHT